jgi:hypothetical protein
VAAQRDFKRVLVPIENILTDFISKNNSFFVLLNNIKKKTIICNTTAIFLIIKIFFVKPLIDICVLRPRNHSLTYREKNCRRGRLRPRLHNLDDVNKGFRGLF